MWWVRAKSGKRNRATPPVVLATLAPLPSGLNAMPYTVPDTITSPTSRGLASAESSQKRTTPVVPPAANQRLSGENFTA